MKETIQTDFIGVMDAYSADITNDYTSFGVIKSIKCRVMALCGNERVPCTIGKILTPTGISAVSDEKTPVPTIEITATPALKESGAFEIPVVVGGMTINKKFRFTK